MPDSRFPCPHCYFPLRIRNREFLGKTIACPECDRGIFILRDEDDRLIGVPSDTEPEPVLSPQPTPTPPPQQHPTNIPVAIEVEPELEDNSHTDLPSDRFASVPASQPTPKRRRKRKQATAATVGVPVAVEAGTVPPAQTAGSPAKSSVGSQAASTPNRIVPNRFVMALTNPLMFAWVGATALVGLLIVTILPDPDQQLAAALENEQRLKNFGPDTRDDQITPVTETKNSTDPVDSDAELRHRLSHLGVAIDAYRKDQGYFPSEAGDPDGLLSGQRFSWQTELVRLADDEAVPYRSDLPWTDELNERFVRRRQDRFLNPNLDRLVGARGYPTTHFVGVAGLGVDGPRLPVDHPRAGIFAIDRVTRPDDIRDGASHTMMVAPVFDRLGSWAESGDATLRPFTEERYINGPDGFGLGPRGGTAMPVLMADGSVRTIDAATDPTIIRRMAAMNDGLPLDPAVPGEPGKTLVASGDDPQKPEPLAPPTPEPADSPVTKPIGAAAGERVIGSMIPAKPELDPNEDEKPSTTEPGGGIDLAAARNQPIGELTFGPQPLRTVLDAFEELLGRPIRFAEGVPETVGGTPVTLTVSATTVEGALETLATRVGLRVEYTDEAVLLHRDMGFDSSTKRGAGEPEPDE